MKIINLSEGFDPMQAEPHELIKYEAFDFGGGEPHIKIESNWDVLEEIIITTRVNNSRDFMLLCLTIEALDHMPNKGNLYLLLPYFPGARQDRIMTEGEPLTVKLYATILNYFQLSSISIFDPHSDVVTAVLENCIVMSNHNFIYQVVEDITNTHQFPRILISPDAGANKKSLKLLQSLHEDGFQMELVKCDKERDVTTGKITNFTVNKEDLEGEDCLIVDDICSNGGTFLGLAKELKKKGCGKLYLAVSHGEFGKDKFESIKNLTEVFDVIYCTDSIFTIDDAWYEAAYHYKKLSLKDKLKQFPLIQI